MNSSAPDCPKLHRHTARGRCETVRGVVFDFDGTLVATRIDFAAMRRAVADLLRNRQLEPVAQGPHHYVLEMVAAGCQALRADAERAAAFEREAMATIEAFEMQTCPYAAPFPGVMETLAQLQAGGYHVGIITRNGRKGVAAITSRYRLPHDLLLTREDVARVKPHPDHLLAALRGLHLKASEALMVGDHPTDMLCGKAAGVLSAGVSRDALRIEELSAAGADFLIPSVPELLPLLNGGQPCPAGNRSG
jgi:phosphoglycolate phosphatase